ncbi:sigma D regulator [Hahella aquimaris]|uniref:sigma D regulator n=1 Tax=Hahella sp. HNIBRBA332 TaxID=3015983 RepID=UPI00273BB8B5|nr:sigma D regulator [Hahella sp. HNIBRBA332]WLQ13653.1 sigma D regulator [Hahella sp. HNIBRBA332]
MLENCQNAKERWGGVSEIIDRWLKERQDLIVRYCDLVGKSKFDDVESAVKNFKTFCQVLLDYVSAGHFEVYEQLIEEAREFNDGGMELVKELFPKIQATTEAALDYNDRFDKTPEELSELNALLPELSKLGERLEERFELEDMLIEKLHNAHADQVA